MKKYSQLKSDSKWKAHFHREFTKGAHGLRPHMWPVRTCVRTYARNSKPIWKALYVEWSLEKDPSRNVNFKLWNYPLLNVLFISNQTLELPFVSYFHEHFRNNILTVQSYLLITYWFNSFFTNLTLSHLWCHSVFKWYIESYDLSQIWLLMSMSNL